MILSSLVVENIFSQIQERPVRIGAVLGSDLGEFESTRDFLKALAEEIGARPLPFQNSLHSSTLGFLSLSFQLTGPCISLSTGALSGWRALETAALLIESKDCDACIALQVDLTPSDLREVIPSSFHNGAAGILLKAGPSPKPLPELKSSESALWDLARGLS
jgi:3-oxoacyl-(acyl-carrier-protein) synthase